MAKFHDRLRQLRKEQSISQQFLADRLGISKSSINMYERGEREPGLEMLESIADYFNVDMDYLMGISEVPNVFQLNGFTSAPSNIIPLPRMEQIPLLGTIACGDPILAAENMEGEVAMPSHIHADFALRCKGDSMINARIFDGDIVYIRHQETVNDGEIAAVLIEDEATLKRVRLFPDHVILEPENPQYRPLAFWGSDMEKVRILGKAVAFTSAVI